MKTKPICTRCNDSKVEFAADAVWNGYKFVIEDISVCYCLTCEDEVGWDMVNVDE